MTVKPCPACHLVNPPEAQVCDCGYLLVNSSDNGEPVAEEERSHGGGVLSGQGDGRDWQEFAASYIGLSKKRQSEIWSNLSIEERIKFSAAWEACGYANVPISPEAAAKSRDQPKRSRTLLQEQRLIFIRRTLVTWSIAYAVNFAVFWFSEGSHIDIIFVVRLACKAFLVWAAWDFATHLDSTATGRRAFYAAVMFLFPLLAFVGLLFWSRREMSPTLARA